MITRYDIDNWFTYHRPTPEQQEKYVRIREKAHELAVLLNNELPDCADTTATFRKLRETIMSANQAIACNS